MIIWSEDIRDEQWPNDAYILRGHGLHNALLSMIVNVIFSMKYNFQRVNYSIPAVK